MSKEERIRETKYVKLEDVIRKRAEGLADTSYREYGNPKNVDDWIEVAESEFKDLPTIEAGRNCISKEWVRENMLKYGFTAPDMTVTEFVGNAPSVVSSGTIVECYVQTCEKNKNGLCGATDIILELGCE